jgi:outer membrane protein OmpA-like peptidoglycan-associated protein
VVSADGQTLYFIRQLPGLNGQMFQRAYQSLWEGAEWGPAEPLPAPINNGNNNGIVSATPDGNTFILQNVYLPNGGMERGYSCTWRTDTGWVFPQQLVLQDYQNLSPYGELHLHASGSILLNTAHRPESVGDKDLFVSFLQPDSTWSKPLNLGPVVNTIASETSPLLAPDGRTLYYSSRGLPGYGDTDVYRSVRLGEGWQNWTPPVNLGPGINTNGFDAYLTLTANGEYAYIAGTGNNGREDIFRIELPPALRPNPICQVRGQVLNRITNQPVLARIEYYDLETGTTMGQGRSTPGTGAYEVLLPLRASYGIRAQAEGYMAVHEQITPDTTLPNPTVEQNLLLVPLEAGQRLRLNNVLFDINSAQLRPASRTELDYLVYALQANPGLRLGIEGHTDASGPREHNLSLSKRRAAAVVKYLVEHGIAVERLTSNGYGPDRPVAPNTTPASKQLNRRVEAVVQ